MSSHSVIWVNPGSGSATNSNSDIDSATNSASGYVGSVTSVASGSVGSAMGVASGSVGSSSSGKKGGFQVSPSRSPSLSESRARDGSFGLYMGSALAMSLKLALSLASVCTFEVNSGMQAAVSLLPY